MNSIPMTVLVPPTTAVSLPPVADKISTMLTELTAALGVNRTVLAADHQIEHAWSNLPRQLSRIPIQHRNDILVRMCVAVAAGLFDSAINYAWNAAIMELRNKVRRFGLNVIPQIINKYFDEETLIELRDVDLLQLCLKLNLISEEGCFLLDQCRDIRNNFSAAHPTVSTLDEDEFLSFLNRVGKHALANEQNPRGVDIQAFIAAVKSARFNEIQFNTWRNRVENTFDAQRELLFGTLHGIFCDPSSGEEARVNALRVCEALTPIMTPKARSDLVSRHQDYKAKGDEPRHKASQQFFERLGFLALLGDTELHSVILSAATNLLSVHNAINNFYNEPPFADRLAGLATQNRIPESAQHDFVEAVITCATGNRYGVSNIAMPTYEKLIRSFSPAEIRIMLELPNKSNVLANRVSSFPKCKRQFEHLVAMIDESSVPTPARSSFEKWKT